MSTRREERIAAMQALYCWEIRSPEIGIEELLAFSWLLKEKKEGEYVFATTLIKEAILHNPYIDSLIQDHLDNWDIKRIGRVDLSILRTAVCELIYCNVPNVITINESVEIAKIFSGDQAPAFINAVLDSIASKYANKQEVISP